MANGIVQLIAGREDFRAMATVLGAQAQGLLAEEQAERLRSRCIRSTRLAKIISGDEWIAE